VQKRRNLSICRFAFGLQWSEGCTGSIVFTRWRQCAFVEGHVAVTCRITLNHPCTSAMRLMANYFDHLLSLDTPTYTVAQIAKRFEPSTVLWAFHTIQPSSYQCICSHCFLLEYDQQTPLNALCSLLIKLRKCSDKFSKHYTVTVRLTSSRCSHCGRCTVT